MFSLARLAWAFLIGALAAGCSGGGGGGDNGPQTPPAPIYSGNTAPAMVTPQNAAALISLAVGEDLQVPPVLFKSLATDSVSPSSNPWFRLIAYRLLQTAAAHAVDDNGTLGSAKVAFNEQIPGLVGGYVQVSGDVSEDGTGTITELFVNYDDGGGRMNGRADVVIEQFDLNREEIVDGTLSIAALEFTAPGIAFRLAGDMVIKTDSAARSETLILDLVFLNLISGASLRTDNLVDVYHLDPSYIADWERETVSGRVYDSALGYIDLTTPVPLFYANGDRDYPSDEGVLIIVGANKASLRVSPQQWPKARVEIDASGNKLYRELGTLDWTTFEITLSIVIDAAIPAAANSGETVTFPVTATSPDGAPVTLKLDFGPPGMTLNDSGVVSWTPQLPMFDSTMSVGFRIRGNAGANRVEFNGTINVTDPARKPALARTGLRIPQREDGIRIADFDGDGTNEILMTDQDKVLALWRFNASDRTYAQSWVYPYDLAPGDAINAIEVSDVNSDGRPDMIVGTSGGIVIVDGVTRTVLKAIESSQPMNLSPRVADLDGDGQSELVFIAASDDFSYPSQSMIMVFALTDFSLKWQSPNQTRDRSLAIANVDDDPALEIITSAGFVYDGKTFANQWTYGPGFGSTVRAGDLDGDGIAEILSIAADAAVVRAYSATAKSPLWEIARFDILYIIF